MNCGETVSAYKDFEIELDYRSTSRVPKYLLIVCSASKYGDYFTGGAGSTMWVDDFSFEYDYQELPLVSHPKYKFMVNKSIILFVSNR